MSFEEEWAQLRAEAGRQQATRMQLNQAPEAGSPAGGGSTDLKSSATQKSKAVKALEEDIEPDTKFAGEVADVATNDAETEFKDWDTGSGLKYAHARWGEQMKALMTRLATEKCALSGTKNLFLSTDQDRAHSFYGIVKPDGAPPLPMNPRGDSS